MNHGIDSAPTRRETGATVLLAGEVETHALSRLSRAELAGYRRRPGPLPEGWGPIQPSALRYSDEQTLAAVAASVTAIRRLGPAAHRLWDQWGIVAAPRFLGRASLIAALNCFRSEGVWGVSCHLIPHYALHAPAGTLSLVLGIRGPNLGIGGGLYAATEGLLTALTWLHSGVVAGVWLVLSGWSPEFLPDQEGEPIGEFECQALALALVPTSSTAVRRPRLQIVAGEVPVTPLPLDLVRLADRLGPIQKTDSAPQESTIHHHLSVHGPHPGSVIPRPHFAPKARVRAQRALIASDATGRLRVELVTPALHHPREDR